MILKTRKVEAGGGPTAGSGPNCSLERAIERSQGCSSYARTEIEFVASRRQGRTRFLRGTLSEGNSGFFEVQCGSKPSAAAEGESLPQVPTPKQLSARSKQERFAQKFTFRILKVRTGGTLDLRQFQKRLQDGSESLANSGAFYISHSQRRSIFMPTE
jgi:hypothetical protein